MSAIRKILGQRDLMTPCMILDDQVVEKNFMELRGAFGPRFDIFYSVKANHEPAVLSAVSRLGGGFDVASLGEIKNVLSIGVSPERIVFSNPIKAPREVSAAYVQGIRLFAADSSDEIEKLASLAPGSSVYIRIAVDNSGSGWPLDGKFGTTMSEAVELLEMAAAKKLVSAGLTFHVGSQCLRADNWRLAIERCAVIWRAVGRKGIKLSLLNIGGGIPVRYAPGTITPSEIGRVANEAISAGIPDARRLIVEPGRFLAADAAAIVASVIGRVRRDGKTLIFLDAGVFNGLMETYECFWYPFECSVEKGNQAETVNLVGPTCDSVDVIAENVLVPPLSTGDKIIFRCAGAYTSSYEAYNGFRFPQVFVASGLLAAEKEKERQSAL